MGYSDQKYQSRPLTMVADSNMATGTFSASGSSPMTAPFALPTFPRRTQVNSIKVVTKAPSKAGTTVTKLVFLNGTNTMGTAAVGTGVAGTEINVTLTTLNTFAAAAGPTCNVLGTATASADTFGAYEIWFETQELPA